MRDVILHLPQWLTNAKDATSPPFKSASNLTLIYFITGNPGLIAYYSTFLKLLAEGAGKNAIVAGASLGGFEVSGLNASVNTLENELLHPPLFSRQSLYDLQGQVNLTYERLTALVSNIKTTYPVASTDGNPIQVILIGHSVGAYIALQLVHRQHALHTSQRYDWKPDATITATMLLTPTIQDIANSTSGKLATPLLSNIPFFPALLQLGASALTSTIPISWLRSLVSRITGMRSGSDALNATVQFLRTPGAVNQALYMAGCEMREIGREEWKDEVWGAAVTEQTEALTQDGTERLQSDGEKEGSVADAESKRPEAVVTAQSRNSAQWTAPKHYFLFAMEDHWVADETREAIVQAVGGRAKVVIGEPRGDEKGLVHAWCLEQSELVAETVNSWLR